MAYLGSTIQTRHMVRREADTAPTLDVAWKLGMPTMKWKNFYAISIHGSLIGNADTFTKFATPQTFNFQGDVTGTSTFDGSIPVSISLAVVDDSHTHDIRYYTKTNTDTTYAPLSGPTLTGNLVFSSGEIVGLTPIPSSNTSATSKDYVDAQITTAINTENNKIDKNGSLAMQSNLSLGNFKITNVTTPTASTDLLNLTTGDVRYLKLIGGTMTGPLNLGGSQLSTAKTPTAANHVGTRFFSDARYPQLTGATLTGALNLGGNILSNLATPTSGNQVPTLTYNDSRYVALSGSTMTGGLTVNTGLTLSNSTLSSPLTPTAGNHVGDRDYNDARYAQAIGGNLNLTVPIKLKQVVETQTTLSISAGVVSINMALGNIFTVVMNQNITSMTFTNIPSTGTVGYFTLILTQDSTGSRIVSWPASVLWANGVTPTLTAAPSDFDTITLITYNGGTNWYGVFAAKANKVPVWQTNSTLGNFNEQSSTNITLTATDADASDTLTYSLISGALPSGLSLSTSGIISGTTPQVTSDTSYSFVVKVLDNHGGGALRTFSMTVLNNINEAPIWTTPSGTLGTANEQTAFSTTVLATDPNGDSITYSVTSGGLPPGLSLSIAGAITGTIGTIYLNTVYNFTITATDSKGGATPRAFSISTVNITNEAPVWSTAAGSLGSYTSGTSVNVSVVATDPNNNTLTYSIISGSLPSGLSLGSGGTISGTPSTANTYNFTIRVDDGLGGIADRAFSMTIDVALPQSLVSIGDNMQDFVISSGSDFSMECFISGAASGALASWDDGGGSTSKWIWWNQGSEIHTNNQSGQHVNISFTNYYVNDGQWHHILITKSSTTWYYFVDGILRGTTTVTVDLPPTPVPTAPLQIGGAEGQFKFIGKMHNFRFTRYQLIASNFTPSFPLSPSSPVSSVLLLPFNNSTNDISGRNHVVVGNMNYTTLGSTSWGTQNYCAIFS
jgi:hypothetical protein